MCNQEMGIHWSSNRMPRWLHSKFKLDPLTHPQWSRHFVDPAFRSLECVSHSMASSIFIWKIDFYWLFEKKKWLGVAILWTLHFGSTRFPFDGELDFCFRKNDLYWLKKWLGVATYFCFIFKRVNKIRKKNPKCDSLFWKRRSVKNRIGFGGQVTYRVGTVRTVAPL